MEQLEQFGFSISALAIVVAAAVAYPAVRFLAKALFQQYFASRRGNPRTEARSPGYVRKTDVFEKLSREQKQLHARAESLLAAGQVAPAADVFEKIGFQRRAVDELEKAGLIDEACAVLIRLNATHRAAVLQERNGRLGKAAELNARLGAHDKAADLYRRLSGKDFRHMLNAEKYYGLAGDVVQQVVCLRALGQVARIVEVCRGGRRHDLLVLQLGNSIFIETALQHLKEQDFELMIEMMPLTPEAVGNLGLWLMAAPPSHIPMMTAFRRLAQDQALLLFFLEVLAAKVGAERTAKQRWSRAALALLGELQGQIRGSLPGSGHQALRFLDELIDCLRGGAVLPEAGRLAVEPTAEPVAAGGEEGALPPDVIIDLAAA